MTIAGVIFDLDGTLVDSGLDFDAMRAEMELPPGPILETMEKLSPAERERCEAILHRHEMAGAERATVHAGAAEWMDALDERRIPRAIFTRNSRSIVAATLARCGMNFVHVFSREDAPPKPDPTAIEILCRTWQLPAEQILVVGDYKYDLLAGRAAGTQTALVTHGRSWDFANLADYVWRTLDEGLSLLRQPVQNHLGPNGRNRDNPPVSPQR